MRKQREIRSVVMNIRERGMMEEMLGNWLKKGFFSRFKGLIPRSAGCSDVEGTIDLTEMTDERNLVPNDVKT